MLFDSTSEKYLQKPPFKCKQLLFNIEDKKISELFAETTFTQNITKFQQQTTESLEFSTGDYETNNEETNIVNYEEEDESDEEFEYCCGGEFSDDETYTKNEEYYFSSSLTCSQNCEEDDVDETLTTPFWYFNEEIEQISEIFAIYQQKLIKERTRSSQLFVGEIKRLNATCGKEFQTFDVVSIYNEQIGSSPFVPFNNSVFIVTTWDRDDGIPVNLFVIDEDEEECLNFWKDRVQMKNSSPSYLFCEPHFYARNEYVYTSSSEKKNLSFQFGYQNLTKSQLISLGC